MPHLFLNSSISQGLLIFIHTAGRKTAGKRIFNTVYVLSGTQSTCGDAHAAWLGTEQVGDRALCPGNTAMGTGWLKHPTICWPNWSSCCRVCNCKVGEATSTACKMMPPATFALSQGCVVKPREWASVGLDSKVLHLLLLLHSGEGGAVGVGWGVRRNGVFLFYFIFLLGRAQVTDFSRM